MTNDGGLLSLNAGHDIQLTASVVSSQGRDSTTRLIAGNDITLDTAKTSHGTDYTRNSENYDRTLESREIGSVVSAGGSLLMQAGRDMNLRAADVTATRKPGPNATKDETAVYNQALKETYRYKTAQEEWITGSVLQQGIQAATAAIQG